MPVFEIDNTRAIAATTKAVLIQFDDDPHEPAEWVPQSAIHENSEVWQDGHTGKLVVFEWFASKAGWL